MQAALSLQNIDRLREVGNAQMLGQRGVLPLEGKICLLYTSRCV